MPPLAPHEVLERLRDALCPGFAPETPEPLTTTKGWLWPGHSPALGPVVAKWPRRAAPLWRFAARRELAVYRAFAAHGAPVAAPTLLAAEPHAGLLVLSRLPGTSLAARRVATRVPGPAVLAALRDALDAIAAWPHGASIEAGLAGEPALPQEATAELRAKMLPDPWAADAWLPALLERAAGLGAVDAGERAWLEAQLRWQSLGHLDLLPRNVLVLDEALGEVAVIDWESAGAGLVGFDAGLLAACLPAAARTALAPRSDAECAGALVAAVREWFMRRHVLRARPDSPATVHADTVLAEARAGLRARRG